MQIVHLCSVISLLLLLIFSKTTHQSQDVFAKGLHTQESAAESHDNNAAPYTMVDDNNGKATSYVLSNIEKAKNKFKPCINDETKDHRCKCHKKMWQKDLEIFQAKGITRQQLKDANEYGTAYKIFNHKLYRHPNCFFPSRCEGIEYFLLKLLPLLPDMDFVINTRDYPQVSGRFTRNMIPVFSFSKTADYIDIMYPAWTFWAGGPAIKLFPTGLGRWDLQREKISKAASKFPWDSKLPKGFFRGSRTSHERDSLILLSRSKPELVDAMYTKNQAWKSPKDTLGADPAQEVSLEHHCQYKYLFNFRGVAASFRFKHLFLCRSLVFHVGDEWLEFFYPALKPWKHYVPLDKNPSESDILHILEFFKTHDNLAKEIADAGYEFIWHHLKMEDVECYWKDLLTNYAKLLKYKIEENRTMIEIKEKAAKHQKHRSSDEF